MKKLPYLAWYSADYLADYRIRSCSMAARGLWREMLDIMHLADPYGHLVTDGVAIDVARLSRLVFERHSDTARWLSQLERKNVFSRTEYGTIYCRRMVKDQQLRELRQVVGRKGGNPILVNQNTNLVNQDVGILVNPKPSQATTTTLEKKATPEILVNNGGVDKNIRATRKRKSAKTSDPRFVVLLDMLFREYQARLGLRLHPCFDASDGKAITRLLKALPDTSTEQFEKAWRCFLNSPDEFFRRQHGQHPVRFWASRINAFLDSNGHRPGDHLEIVTDESLERDQQRWRLENEEMNAAIERGEVANSMEWLARKSKGET